MNWSVILWELLKFLVTVGLGALVGVIWLMWELRGYGKRGH